MPGGISPELHRGAKALLFLGKLAFPVNRINLIEHKMADEAKHNGPRFENSDFEVVGKTDHKSNQSSDDRGGNTMPHAAVFREPTE